jgi:predicted DNA-binding transcriptional regulator AlpA
VCATTSGATPGWTGRVDSTWSWRLRGINQATNIVFYELEQQSEAESARLVVRIFLERDLRKRGGVRFSRHFTSAHFPRLRDWVVERPTKDNTSQSLQRTATAVEELLTMPEVAELTRLPIATLRWYRATGQGGPKSGKVGGRRVMYRRADVEAWIQSAFESGVA